MSHTRARQQRIEQQVATAITEAKQVAKSGRSGSLRDRNVQTACEKASDVALLSVLRHVAVAALTCM